MLTWWAGGVQSTTGLFCGAGWEELFSFECESDQRGGDRLQKEDDGITTPVCPGTGCWCDGGAQSTRASTSTAGWTGIQTEKLCTKKGDEQVLLPKEAEILLCVQENGGDFLFYQWVVLSAVYFIAASEKTVSVTVTDSKLDTFETCKKCFTSCDHRLHHSLDTQWITFYNRCIPQGREIFHATCTL